MAESTKPQARTREGVVVSNAMDKTAVVQVKRRIRHRRYHKFIVVNKKYITHDERNECNPGDLVVISESRPLSKRKRWRLRSIVTRAVEDAPEAPGQP